MPGLWGQDSVDQGGGYTGARFWGLDAGAPTPRLGGAGVRRSPRGARAVSGDWAPARTPPRGALPLKLVRVKPTEPAILDMVRSHYSYRESARQRPRTTKTGKTWWSNAKLVVFTDEERTLVFAWQWPRDGYRKDGQNGFNNTLFHRSARCPFLASDIVLAAEQAVVGEWGENRAYTYVDGDAVTSSNPGYCYKKAGWRLVGYSKGGKALLEKQLVRAV